MNCRYIFPKLQESEKPAVTGWAPNKEKGDLKAELRRPGWPLSLTSSVQSRPCSSVGPGPGPGSGGGSGTSGTLGACVPGPACLLVAEGLAVPELAPCVQGGSPSSAPGCRGGAAWGGDTQCSARGHAETVSREEGASGPGPKGTACSAVRQQWSWTQDMQTRNLRRDPPEEGAGPRTWGARQVGTEGHQTATRGHTAKSRPPCRDCTGVPACSSAYWDQYLQISVLRHTAYEDIICDQNSRRGCGGWGGGQVCSALIHTGVLQMEDGKCELCGDHRQHTQKEMGRESEQFIRKDQLNTKVGTKS
ncbi:uncharacterized protein LOC119519129 [Choloepus didactylus]|uniref:uncharacterized protein LOC119519129 n=1 Tax=Choloepus didactylus TaxID=27675 RepID=UPI00189C6510|nr:uncharacterized protein LOC119519129 [Choloepus didactylus]